MTHLSRRPFIVAAVILFSLMFAGSASGDDDSTIDSYGLWTLQHLGYDDLTLSTHETATEVSIKYALMSGASQGPDDWYMIHLHLALEVAGDSGAGFALVSGVTNRWAGAQIKFEADQSQRLRWSSVDLLNGQIGKAVATREAEIRFSNYLPVAGVQEGENELKIKLERFENIEVSKLVVFRDSGIELTPLSPPKLELEPILPHQRVSPGDEFEIGYKLTNAGDQPAKKVVVGIVSPPEAFTRIGDAPHKYTSVTGTIGGSFRLIALKEGTHRIVLGAESPSGRPVAEMQAVVYPPDPSRSLIEWVGVVVLVVLAGAAVIGLIRRSLLRQLKSSEEG